MVTPMVEWRLDCEDCRHLTVAASMLPAQSVCVAELTMEIKFSDSEVRLRQGSNAQPHPHPLPPAPARGLVH